MEYIAYNPQVILTLVKDKNYRKRILKARENELLINLKLKCISVLFDSIIDHNRQTVLRRLISNERINVSERIPL